jgi:hypothetical protein
MLELLSTSRFSITWPALMPLRLSIRTPSVNPTMLPLRTVMLLRSDEKTPEASAVDTTPPACGPRST